ncbi:hypothetical protein [Virgibacillus halodenitrificans]|uniref:hypothetical protein n=1 Tax=Virgibacillus halodenitrificans TaxID=1482 RepID=UPI000EF4FFFD|nr:hypothetical protein [Virgibacillus halodenitrificans]
MENKEIQTPNFMLLKPFKGTIYQVTICKNTLDILEEKVISEIPVNCSVNDFYELLDEGKRFFEKYDVSSTRNYQN